MRVALRALGIATAVLWILVGAFVGLCIYSALKVSIKGISADYRIQGTTARMLMNVTIVNGGFFDITDLNLSTCLYMPLVRAELNRSSTLVPAIRSGGEVNITHTFVLDIAAITARPAVLRALFLNSTDLVLIVSISLTYAYVFGVELSANQTVPWGAPLSNLRVSSPILRLVGSEIELEVHVSFENEAPFSFSFWLRALNGHGDQIGTSETFSIDTGASFSQLVSIKIPLSDWTGSGSIEACVYLGVGPTFYIMAREYSFASLLG